MPNSYRQLYQIVIHLSELIDKIFIILKMKQDPRFTRKLCIIGAPFAGKSTFLSMVTQKKATENYNRTIGVDYRAMNYNIKKNPMRLVYWDISQQMFVEPYLKSSNACIGIFQLTSQLSFNYVKQLLCKCSRIIKTNKRQYQHYIEPVVILVGNKRDLKDTRQVQQKQIKQFCTQMGFHYVQISSYCFEQAQSVIEMLLMQFQNRAPQYDRMLENLAKPKIDKYGHTGQPLVNLEKPLNLFNVRKQGKN